MTACQNCVAGPAGIEGHESLFVHTMDRGQMQFKCRACDCVWIRRYSGASQFEWVSTIGERGMEVPRG